MLIPGVRTVHVRSVWEEPGFRVSGPASPGVYHDMVGHYPGAGDVPDHDYRGHVYVDPARFHGDLVGYFRSMQRAYLRDRGYSVGYQFGIDYLGGLTVLRGFDIQNAANAGSKLPGNWNRTSCSAQFVTDLTRPATDLALYTFAMVVAHLRHHGHRAAVKRHDDGEWTACPGAVGAQLSAGMGDPAWWQRVGPPQGAAPLPWYLAGPIIPPIDQEDSMPAIIVVDTRLRGTFACVGGRWVPWLAPAPPGVPVWTGDHPWTREQILADQGEAAAGLWRERMQATK